ncbi:MAG: DinB family protein [Phycisphaerales bacterium]
MNDPLTAHLQRMLAYETWANERAIASIETVPPELRTRPAYLRAVQLPPHIMLARMVWLLRIRATPYESPRDWFPSWPLDETRRQLSTVDSQWRDFLASLHDPDLTAAVHYTSAEGARYQSSTWDICTHVFNHATYHRGQVARLVAESGGQRAATDLIVFTRTQQ